MFEDSGGDIAEAVARADEYGIYIEAARWWSGGISLALLLVIFLLGVKVWRRRSGVELKDWDLSVSWVVIMTGFFLTYSAILPTADETFNFHPMEASFMERVSFLAFSMLVPQIWGVLLLVAVIVRRVLRRSGVLRGGRAEYVKFWGWLVGYYLLGVLIVFGVSEVYLALRPF